MFRSRSNSSLPSWFLSSYSRPTFFGMADRLPVLVPSDYTRGVNKNHNGESRPCEKRFSYGTAGFRSNSDDLTFIACRSAYLAGLRSRVLKKTIGIMITASHNPACDNGVKIVDPMGEMMAAEWEAHATKLVNASDEEFPTAVRALELQYGTNINEGRVVVAMDTRESGAHLKKSVKAGLDLCGVTFVDHGILTTPQLHYIVRCENDPEFGEANEDGYYKVLSSNFNELLKYTTPKVSNSTLYLDCANGVGAPQMRKLLSHLSKNSLEVEFFNEKGELNEKCGADFVKIGQVLPISFEGVTSSSKCASFDGDADRLVYFRRTSSDSNRVLLLDGDRIAVLIAMYIKKLFNDDKSGITKDLTLGMIQTAYANGASTKYITQDIGISPTCVPTGVKHLHHAAIKYDVGIYFEANGHGTVVFSEKFNNVLRKSNSDDLAIKKLKLMSRVINEVVGDAMSDLLAVEIILQEFGWSIEDWETKLYTDLPNVQVKLPVTDRSIYKTTWDETTLLEPQGLQEKIDNIVKSADGGIRAFVRPSGTENIVRIYVEALTSCVADQIGKSIADLLNA